MPDMDFRKALFDNAGIKLLSLSLAVILWFFVTSKGKTEMTLRVPLELRNIPQNMAVVGDVAGSVEVRIQGQERAMRDVTTGKSVYGTLDLSRATLGEAMYPLSPDDIRRPSGVTVVYLSPPGVRVKREPLVRRTVRLKPVLRGVPAQGFRVAKILVSMPRVNVEGPASVMRRVDELPTMPIDIQGAETTVMVEPKIDYQGKAIRILDSNILVRIVIERTKS
jgi:YbbR domain-containing protein